MVRDASSRLRYLFKVSSVLLCSMNHMLTSDSWGNWQYQAGVGNDPRSSRQFNPIKQAGDYDAEGKYVRLWIPELKDVDDMYLQTPWCESQPRCVMIKKLTSSIE